MERSGRLPVQNELAAMDAPDEIKTTCIMKVLKRKPSLRIAEYVSKTDSPLVVMPTHGHGAFRRFVLCSVTAKTLHDLKCPILTGVHLDDSPSVPARYVHDDCLRLGPHRSWPQREGSALGRGLRE